MLTRMGLLQVNTYFNCVCGLVAHAIFTLIVFTLLFLGLNVGQGSLLEFNWLLNQFFANILLLQNSCSQDLTLIIRITIRMLFKFKRSNVTRGIVESHSYDDVQTNKRALYTAFHLAIHLGFFVLDFFKSLFEPGCPLCPNHGSSRVGQSRADRFEFNVMRHNRFACTFFFL